MKISFVVQIETLNILCTSANKIQNDFQNYLACITYYAYCFEVPAELVIAFSGSTIGQKHLRLLLLEMCILCLGPLASKCQTLVLVLMNSKGHHHVMVTPGKLLDCFIVR